MTYLIQKVLALFNAHPALASISGPWEDEAPADVTRLSAEGVEPEYCVYTATGGLGMTYLSGTDTRKATHSIVLSIYTTTRGRTRAIQDAVDAQFDQKQFDFTDGRCDWSRVVSRQVGYAGLNERSRRLYSATIAIAFDCHIEADSSLAPAHLPA